MSSPVGQRIYMVGIKGTGMSSLALYLCDRGHQVAGWDVPENFLGEKELERRHIRIDTDSDPIHFRAREYDVLIYSSAHEQHALLSAADAVSLIRYSYHEYLGMLSAAYPTIGVAGTHGKSTSAGCIDSVLSSLDVPHGAIYGARPVHVPSLHPGLADELLVLEACEYRNHFHSYHINTLLITNAEWEHVDFYEHEQAVEASFRSLIDRLPPSGTLVMSMNTRVCRSLLLWTKEHRTDLSLLTYGTQDGQVTYTYPSQGDEHQVTVHLAGEEHRVHTALAGSGFLEDIIGAALAVCSATGADMLHCITLAGRFGGCRNRVERLSDRSSRWHLYSDYAHHPSEIRSSIGALRLLHPGKRIIVCFYPHTVSRTRALWDGFISALGECDILFIAPVSSTARHDGSAEEAEELSIRLCRQTNGTFAASDETMKRLIMAVLREDDVCVTMGAGNTYGIRRLLEGKEGEER